MPQGVHGSPETNVSMFSDGITDVKGRVIEILRLNKEARDHDLPLLIDYYEKYYQLSKHMRFITREDGKRQVVYDRKFLEYATPPETVTRWRRKLQEDPNFPYQPSVGIKVMRKRAEAEFKEFFRKDG